MRPRSRRTGRPAPDGTPSPRRGAGGPHGGAVECGWKPNWEETKRRFVEWWEHRGLVLGMWDLLPAAVPHEPVPDPGPPASVEASYTDHAWRSRHVHHRLSRSAFPAEILPKANVSLGPGSLALLLGARAEPTEETVWYGPVMEDVAEPERLPPLAFDPDNRWWKVHENSLKACAALAPGRYAVACPDLIENTDILASLRGVEAMLTDMIERPDWVHRKLREINRAWFEAYGRVYEIVKLADGSSIFGAFALWGPGKTAKVQCDSAAMLSPAMFRTFVVPVLEEQCGWLDHSMFHLDGEHCLGHLDALLEIGDLDAVEWTPNPKVPSGGSPRWYDMYRRILAAGKSVQAIGVKPEEVVPLLDACGGAGMYIMTTFESEARAEELLKAVEPYRPR